MADASGRKNGRSSLVCKNGFSDGVKLLWWGSQPLGPSHAFLSKTAF